MLLMMIVTMLIEMMMIVIAPAIGGHQEFKSHKAGISSY